MNGKVNLGILSMEMSTGNERINISVMLNDKVLHSEMIKGGKVDQVAAVMTLRSAGLISAGTAEIFLDRINNKK